MGDTFVIAYPLLLEPHYDVKIWGGRRLETVLGKHLPDDGPVGESIESGGDARVVNGPLAGQTLNDLIARDGQALLGERGMTACGPFGDFPLLVKFIDASDVLSLQLHPDDDGARTLNKRGKTEAWYIVQAQPGAQLDHWHVAPGQRRRCARQYRGWNLRAAARAARGARG